MTQNEMEAEICLELLGESSRHFQSRPDERKLFIAGMRAAARIAAECSSNQDDGVVRIRLTAFELERQ